MNRPILLIATLAMLSTGSAVNAQSNTVLSEYLSRVVKKELAKHNSEETAWYSEKSDPKKKWAEVKIAGKVVARTIVAEWTEESKTWLWLDDPNNTLKVNISKLELSEGVLSFGVNACGKARGKAWGKIPNLVTADVRLSANVDIIVEGKAKINNGKFTEVDVSKLSGKLSDLRFNNDALKLVQGLVQDCANEYVRFKNDDLKKAMKKAIEGFGP